MDDVELVCDARADLGEAPVWDDRAGLLIWVDITRGHVHRFEPVSGRDETLAVGRPVGAAVPTTDGRLALAVSDGFELLDPTTGELERLADVEADLPDTIMNDGKCDPPAASGPARETSRDAGRSERSTAWTRIARSSRW
jgi:sugar lactone lactonase YvrE